jgi:hypothetical protein
MVRFAEAREKSLQSTLRRILYPINKLNACDLATASKKDLGPGHDLADRVVYRLLCDTLPGLDGVGSLNRFRGGWGTVIFERVPGS